ncbi:phosphotransferase family protein [Amycolatopsis sp. 195334CR]|uniref:phosphotransferase family protein n=1 Tax=Amycolatopsis sp. 195334CR TaxID=2814588 RepID=UPI001A90BE30|nr:aminoglycoside 3'-phosphotransferase/choline kinase family protein [Amycolatopsis sp. 195334CR]MBN6037130.1 aminoglycoside 3'-phosphotransferase/choline kinase family protein [Amycolatopsis sp. 195334CR]
MPIFPGAATEAQFEALTEEQLRPGVTALLAELDMADQRVERFEDGSLPVYAVGDELVLKLFPPVHLDEVATEAGVLRALDGKLPIPTPHLARTGEVDGWGYVLMSRLTGESLSSVWGQLTGEDKDALAQRLGEALAALHRTPAPDLGPADWSDFIATQRANAVERQRSAGLAEEWLEQIPAFLAEVELGTPEPVLLHTEFMRDHLLVQRGPGGWALSGIFDFEPAMRGAPEYDLVGVGVFVAGGDLAFFRRLLLAYGYTPEQLDTDFARRCLAYTLLHVYSNLPWYLKVMPEPARPTLDALAQRWFGA